MHPGPAHGDGLADEGKGVLGHGLVSCRAEGDGVDGIAHAAGDVLHGGWKILLEVDGVIDGAVLRVDLLLLRE